LNTTGSICRKHERSKKSQALRMMILWGLEYNWFNMQKTRKIEKVTGSQDDDLAGGLNTTGSICRKHEKIEKVTGSQDDDLLGA
jgi:hypothetical protein